MEKGILIQKYLQTGLSVEESAIFHELLEQDSEFANMLDTQTVLYANRSAGFKIVLSKHANDYLRSKLREFLVSSFRNEQDVLDKKTNEILQTCEQFVGQKHHAPAVMMNQQTSNNDFALAMEAFKHGHYEISINRLKEINDKQHPELLFYMALSHLYLSPSNYTLAIFYFERVLEATAVFKQEEVRWYLALCYLKTGKIEQALTLFQRISKEKSWKFSEAKKLLGLFRD